MPKTMHKIKTKVFCRSILSLFAFFFCLLATVVSGYYCRGYSCRSHKNHENHKNLGSADADRGPRSSPFEDFFWATAIPTYFKATSRGSSSQFSYHVHEDDDKITLTLTLPGYSANTVELELTSKIELRSTQHVLVVSPSKDEDGTVKGPGFASTSFTIDKKVRCSDILQ